MRKGKPETHQILLSWCRTEVSEVQLLTHENRFANFIGKSFLIYAKIAASVTLALRDSRSARRDSRSVRRDSRSARNETRLVTFLWAVLYGTATTFFVKTRLTSTPPPPLNNVESKESKMSQMSCTLYGLQHCVGGGGGGETIQDVFLGN